MAGSKRYFLKASPPDALSSPSHPRAMVLRFSRLESPLMMGYRHLENVTCKRRTKGITDISAKNPARKVYLDL